MWSPRNWLFLWSRDRFGEDSSFSMNSERELSVAKIKGIVA